jgi:hypothetical protein
MRQGSSRFMEGDYETGLLAVMRQASSLFRGGKRGRRGDGAVWEGGVDVR